ncbi:MAG: hypothetical protein ACP5FX_00410 [Candidatus Micrarchaeia archaeon]
MKKYQRSFSVAKAFILLLILLFNFSKAIDIGYSDKIISYLNTSIQNTTNSCFLNFSSGGKVCIILFYGQGCPHCAQEREFLKTLINEEAYKDKIKIIELEVYYNKTNQELYQKTARMLNLSESEMGVPLTLIGKKAFLGFAYSSTPSTSTTSPLPTTHYFFFLILFILIFCIIFYIIKRWKNAR